MCFSAARIMMFDMCGTHRRLGSSGATHALYPFLQSMVTLL
ncbi:hypothetical protein HMPREF0742_01022 [Rothia aeria F0184]|uniref:Uncharacterized protein n=1 Tax=Rothia aeria F0184 TaxID=888019 RepID=U7V5E2_9MICC|nr:hypothetical protein HMPREF0742_01022 [Rothia aeria F0184]